MRDTRYEIGSALILAVVLTSLLAIVGVMFLMVARVNRMATSGISENKELDSAVETVIAKISQELVLDVLDMSDPNRDYYDYPIHRLDPGPDGITGTADDALFDPGLDGIYGTVDDSPTYPGPDGIYETIDDIPVTGVLDDYWLANLEPEIVDVGGDMGLPPDMDFGFRHITDLYGRLAYLFQDSFNYSLNSVEYTDLEDDRISFRNMRATIIASALPIQSEGDKADADGDGVADSRWIKLPNMSSSKGKPIYAAIRIVDNGGMLNVNTIFADPNAGDKRKGDMLTDIYIDGLVKLGGDQIFKFIENRSGNPAITEVAAQQYHIEVSRRVENPAASNPPYTLYDISEELSLRNRFILHPNQTITRLESGSEGDPNRCLSTTLRWRGYGNAFRPYSEWANLSDAWDAWIRRFDPFDVGAYGNEPQKNNYDFRHLLTTYNMDRIINPVGQFLNQGKMVNVNRINPIAEPNVTDLYNTIWVGLYDAGVLDPNSLAAQMAVNIVDYRDADSDVTVYNGYYGFERPCVYISELVYKEDVNDPAHRSYAIELYKPYFEDNDPCGWQLVIDGGSIDITWSGGKQFHVVLFEDSNAPLTVSPTASIQTTPFVVFDVGDLIELQRFVADVNNYIVVDSIQVPAWLPAGAGIQSRQRDITLHKCIRRLWADASEPNSLGDINIYKPVEDWIYIQAHPANARFTNIGEIGTVFRKSAYPEGFDVIEPSDTEDKVRINLADPRFQQIFNYLTVFDPSSDLINNDGDYVGALENIDENNLDETPEWKIPGRININTAPWYVIAQLPWISNELAQAIVAYKDKTFVPGGPDYRSRPREPGFASIGELSNVVSGDPNYRMDYYALDPNDLQDFPDLTPRDGAINDFEERDVIFARISNLVTVRSDVFTAYILVRIGADGPQKRVIAILDRSNVYSSDGKVRIVALHPVPDPR